MLDQILATAQEHDTFAAIEQIHALGDPLKIAALYAEAANALYWKAKDLPAAIAFSRAGIQQNLLTSMPPCPAEISVKLRSNAKALAYNLGSFTWDGWDEPGITVTKSDLAVGRDAARLNLRLAIELHKPPKALGNAHWLVAAHALSAGDFNEASEQFAESARACDDPLTPVMNRGYLALTNLLCGREPEAAGKAFDAAVTALNATESEDGKFLANQLISVRRFFESKQE